MTVSNFKRWWSKLNWLTDKQADQAMFQAKLCDFVTTKLVYLFVTLAQVSHLRLKLHRWNARDLRWTLCKARRLHSTKCGNQGPNNSGRIGIVNSLTEESLANRVNVENICIDSHFVSYCVDALIRLWEYVTYLHRWPGRYRLYTKPRRHDYLNSIFAEESN